jgi:parallel beta-helix repeat protein
MTNEIENETYDRIRSFNGVNFEDYGVTHGSIASVLEHGEVINDTGEQYESIQPAVDDAEGWVFVGPGTYHENVFINKDEFYLQGAGTGTTIHGPTGDDIIEVNSTEVTIDSIHVSGNGTGLSGDGRFTLTNSMITDVSDAIDFFSRSGSVIAISNYIDGTLGGIHCRGSGKCIVSNNIIKNTGSIGIYLNNNSDNIVSNNIILNAETWGMDLNSAFDSIVISNRIENSANDGILITGSSADNIIANNRVSGSGANDIDDNGTGTVLDSNVTG